MFSVLKSFYLSPFEIPDNYNIAMACIELELTMPVHTLSDIADYLSTKLFFGLPDFKCISDIKF
jgi:hypothetical protein